MTPAEFFDALERLFQWRSFDLALYAGVLTRMSAIAFLAPGLGEQVVPMRVRLAAVFALTAIVGPSVASSSPADVPEAASFVRLVAAEAAVGLVIGFGLRAVIFVLQIAGSIAAQHMSLTQLLGPGVGHDQESPLSTILIMAGLAAAASANLHIYLAASLIDSYAAFPIGALPKAAEAGAWASSNAGDVITLAFELSLPFVLLGVAYSLALAATSRAMPQLMAAFVGAPAVIFAGMILFATSSPVILGRWLPLLARVVADPSGGLR